MREIKTYQAEYESEGELFEDFPGAFEIKEVMFDPVKHISTFEFKLAEIRNKQAMIEKSIKTRHNL